MVHCSTNWAILSPAASTTSTVTTSVACDCIPGDDVELLNHMCVLVLTRCNGTPFNATSIQEEAIIELWVELGQTNPKCVLWYLAVESVVLFHFMDIILVVACVVIKATALHKELIRLCMTPPSTAHVRAYTMVRDGEPSDTQPPIPEREEEPQPSPSDPHPDGRTPHQFQMDLGDAQLRQLMEDLWQEEALRELNAPPVTNHQATGDSNRPWGPQCGWPGGHLPEREGMGTKQEDNHLDPLPPSTRWRCRTSHKHTSHQTATGHPMHQHFQSQSHAGEDRSVFWAMVPWGTVCERPLSRISGLEKYSMIAKGGSSGYVQIHGPYHHCGPYSTNTNHNLWHCGIIQCLNAKCL